MFIYIIREQEPDRCGTVMGSLLTSVYSLSAIYVNKLISFNFFPTALSLCSSSSPFFPRRVRYAVSQINTDESIVTNWRVNFFLYFFSGKRSRFFSKLTSVFLCVIRQLRGDSKRNVSARDCLHFSRFRNPAEMSHTCRGTISLHGALIHTVDACTFVVSNGGTQTFHIKASTEVERQQWVTALELAKAKAIQAMESGLYSSVIVVCTYKLMLRFLHISFSHGSFVKYLTIRWENLRKI